MELIYTTEKKKENEFRSSFLADLLKMDNTKYDCWPRQQGKSLATKAFYTWENNVRSRGEPFLAKNIKYNDYLITMKEMAPILPKETQERIAKEIKKYSERQPKELWYDL